MSRTKVMGIINVTPDSFYAGSRCYQATEALKVALQMAEEGAYMLDIGGESTRPGAKIVSLQEEIDRVIPAIEAITREIAIPISIDTYKPDVARAAVKAGATLINDVTGFTNPNMIALAASSQLDICVMHMQGTPKTMQQNPSYVDGITSHLLSWFESKIAHLLSCGVEKKNIILDPGIGFGKTVDDNLEIIHNLAKLKNLGFRVLLGTSRKSFLSKILSKPTAELLSATLAINSIAVAAHVDMIRVHDVKEHRDMVDILSRYTETTFRR